MGTDLKTDFLVPTSSFMVGVGSVMNIGGDYFEYRLSASPEEADALALRSDWNNVGKDVGNACEAERAELDERSA